MNKYSFLLAIPVWLFAVSCKSTPGAETPLPVQTPVTAEPERPVSTGGIVDEIRGLAEKGIPSALIQAMDLIRSRDISNTEFGRVMNGVCGTILKIVYPAVKTQIPQMDLPQNHNYARILRDIEKGIYTSGQNSRDFLELALPFLALYGEVTPNAAAALPDLQKAADINPDSVLACLFMGMIYENSGWINEARDQYARAWSISAECYPAALGIARAMELQGQSQEEAVFLSDLAIRFPDNFDVKRRLAIAYYQNGDWSRAEPAIAEILQRDSRDGEFILMRAHVLVEQGQYTQAQAPLDVYASINPNNRLYLYLRARIQFEGFRNRDAALNYLRSLLRNSPVLIDDEASVYAARLLMESSRESDQAEGRNLLQQLLNSPNPSLTLITLALSDAIRSEDWVTARDYMNLLLSRRRSSQDLLNAYTVEKGQGNNAAALSYARELYERDPGSEEGVFAYITALIDTGRSAEAAGMIESRLKNAASGVSKSRYYFLRSMTQKNEDTAMNDLRSSLFEDPRNLNALIAMFEIYHRRKDERRAVYYLKQALALSPDNPRLKRYETEYAPLLGAM